MKLQTVLIENTKEVTNMEQSNFKRLKCDDGKEYIFNFEAFKMELKRAAVAAKKAGRVSTIEKFEKELADKVAVTSAAIKQWKAGRNGVSDIERIMDIAHFLELKDYKELLIEQIEDNRKDDTIMNNYVYETERKSAKEAFDGMVYVITLFKNTNAYSLYDDYGAPSAVEVIVTNEEAEIAIKKARFDISKEIYDKLIQLYYAITNTEPDEIESDNNISREFAVERIGDAYYSELCEIMKSYLK